MNAFLLVPFLLSCCLGAIAAWRVKPADAPALAGVILLLCSAILAGALIVAAEVGSATARYLGLLAVLLASAALSGAFIATRRSSRAERAKTHR